MSRKAHWEQVYDTKASDAVSWFQPEPTRSLEILRRLGTQSDTTIIDIGGGDSTLVDTVVAEGLGQITVLDISGTALARARSRLALRADQVRWIEADITAVELPIGAFDVWHDRAVFHFLTNASDRAQYVSTAASAVRAGGTLIIATFALDGPTRCSGLDIVRYGATELAKEFGAAFTLRSSFADVHRTPSGSDQRFTFAEFERGATNS